MKLSIVVPTFERPEFAVNFALENQMESVEILMVDGSTKRNQELERIALSGQVKYLWHPEASWIERMIMGVVAADSDFVTLSHDDHLYSKSELANAIQKIESMQLTALIASDHKEAFKGRSFVFSRVDRKWPPNQGLKDDNEENLVDYFKRYKNLLLKGIYLKDRLKNSLEVGKYFFENTPDPASWELGFHIGVLLTGPIEYHNQVIYWTSNEAKKSWSRGDAPFWEWWATLSTIQHLEFAQSSISSFGHMDSVSSAEAVVKALHGYSESAKCSLEALRRKTPFFDN